MTPIAHIRQNVFSVSQAAFGALADASQPTVCRWETGELQPDARQMSLIRDAAKERAIQWEDRWFFEVPILSGAAA